MDTYKFTVERTSTGYAALCESEGALTTATTFNELKKNMVDILNFSLADTGKTVTGENIALVYDIPSFFEVNKFINVSGLAKEIGMTQSLLSQYVSGNKKPSAAQTQRILAGIQQVGRKLVELELAA